MATVEERLSRLEGGYEHVATKEDVANLKAELKADMGKLKFELFVSLTGVVAVAAGVIVAIDRVFS